MQVLTGQPITDPAELASLIAEIIREDIRWDQGVWWGHTWFRNGPEVDVTKARESIGTGCGATGCCAGWAVIFHAPAGSRITSSDFVVLPDGREFFASAYGQLALALDDERATWLFDGKRTRTEVLYALDAITEGRSWSPAEGDALPEADADYADDEDDDEDSPY